MSQTFTAERRVEFSDTDLAGFVHFTNYLRYMEETEYAFLRSVGLGVVMEDEQGQYGFPRRQAHCEYLFPARYDQILQVGLQVTSNDGKLIRYDFKIEHESTLLATGYLQTTCVRFPRDKQPYAMLLPEEILAKIPLC